MSNSINSAPTYGYQDTSYNAAGKEDGLRKLSVEFYKNMNELPEAKTIRAMHEDDLDVMVEKLTLFLTMWLGGPKKFIEKYGRANMPQAHQHLVINEDEKKAWLLCMDKAVDNQPFREDFKTYLKEQFRFPAELIRKTSRDS